MSGPETTVASDQSAGPGPRRPVLVLAHVFPRTLEDSMGAFLLHLADALAARGVPAEVVAPHAAGLADREVLGSARVHRFHYAPARWERLAYTGTMHELVGRSPVNLALFVLFNLAFLLKALSVQRACRARLIHAHWWLPGGLAGAVVSLLTRTPLVITTHGTDVEMLRRTRWAVPLARLAFGRAAAITCGSTFLRDQLVALGVADSRRVQVIPMPVNPLFTVQPLSPVVDTGQAPLILTVARLTRQKGVHILIGALAVLRQRGCAARLAIIGDGPERGPLQAQAHALELDDGVEFLGALPSQDLPPHYARCAVFVLPSIREGMGLVLAEALFCGVPVIATNSGGVTDIVREGETGLLVPERDAGALAVAIESMLHDRALAARLAANGQAWVRDRFDPARVAGRFGELYAGACSHA